MLSRASVRIVLLETPQDRRSNKVKNGKQPFLHLHDLEQYFTAFDGQLRAFRDTN
jgi:hypothetical protein